MTDVDQEIYLQSSPPMKYIIQKLRKVMNNDPGLDKIECVHLKLIDKSGLLMESILGAAHSLELYKL